MGRGNFREHRFFTVFSRGQPNHPESYTWMGVIKKDSVQAHQIAEVKGLTVLVTQRNGLCFDHIRRIKVSVEHPRIRFPGLLQVVRQARQDDPQLLTEFLRPGNLGLTFGSPLLSHLMDLADKLLDVFHISNTYTTWCTGRSMLSELHRVYKDVLPGLLLDTSTSWNTLEVLYEEPRVERLWLQLGDNRLYLHRIHPCKRAFFHPHPWPSAVLVVSGKYLMEVGKGDRNGPAPAAVMTAIMGPGSAYEMLDPDGWHSVQPLDAPSYSVMLTGKPWSNTPLSEGQRQTNQPLSIEATKDLLDHFWYLVRNSIGT